MPRIFPSITVASYNADATDSDDEASAGTLSHLSSRTLTIVLEPYDMLASFLPHKLRRLLFGNARLALSRLEYHLPRYTLRKWYLPARGLKVGLAF